MEPDDLVPAATIAEWVDLNDRQVRALATAGVIQRTGKGFYRLRPTVRAIVVHLREQAAGRIPAGAVKGIDLVEERAKLAKSQREAQDMRNATLRGELLPGEVVDEVVGGVIFNVRTAFLAMPHKIVRDWPRYRVRRQSAPC